jgi:uncharacterized protein with HEPN domain
MISDQDALRVISSAIERTRLLREGLDRTRFIERMEKDWIFAAAVSFQLVQIGELVSGMMAGGRSGRERDAMAVSRHPEVDWQGFVDMAETLLDNPPRATPGPLWEQIEVELPPLSHAIEGLVR